MTEHTHDTIETEDLMVTLSLDNDEEINCVVICFYTVKEQQYIALLPVDENGEEYEDGEVFLYRYADKDGEPVIDVIESDDEYEAAADAFDEWLDEQEFDEIQEQLDED